MRAAAASNGSFTPTPSRAWPTAYSVSPNKSGERAHGQVAVGIAESGAAEVQIVRAVGQHVGGAGMPEPVASDDDETSRARNRRLELVWL